MYYGHFIADFSFLRKFIRDVAASATMYRSESKQLVETTDNSEERMPLYYSSNLDRIERNLGKAMDIFFRLKKCPGDVAEYVTGYHLAAAQKESAKKESIKIASASLRSLYQSYMPGGYLKPQGDGTRPSGIFDSHILYDIQDVMIIETEETTRGNELSFEITTIKGKGLPRFHNFLKSIPHIGNTVKELKRRKTHSSRYAFRPYPLAVQLWLSQQKTLATKKDLKDFIRGSIRYHYEKEWRTSIILSAIAVESILADLYEEQNMEYAPSTPLGDLYNRVRTNISFPAKVQEAIELVNKARISAVHRSRFPVSGGDATNALYGAVILIMWYSSNF